MEKHRKNPSRPVLSTMFTTTTMTMTMASWNLRKLEVVHKEVGGYLPIAQIENYESLSQSVS